MDFLQTYLKYEPIGSFKDALSALLNQKKVLDEDFSHLISFGTAGLRGLMKPGLSGINGYTIGIATKALALYLRKLTPHKKLTVCISYDNRHHSMQFAEIAARVLAHEGIFVKLSKRLRPTPWLSFAIKTLHADAGIMITASHNPPVYNGYKVYLSDGGQVVSPHDKNIMQLMQQITSFDFAPSSDPHIELIDELIDKKYLENLKTHVLKETHPDLLIAYTPLCGTGITLIPEALEEIGFTHLKLVEEESRPDPDFASIATPNPETLVAMKRLLALIEKTGADIGIATDPDADRIGLVARHGKELIRFSGNEIALLLLDYLIQHAHSLKNKVVVSSFVTTHLIKKICTHHRIEHKEVLTGFKYIGQIIEELEQKGHQENFLMGAEESYGYLIGTHAKDKDAIITAAVLAKAAQESKRKHQSLYDRLLEIYKRFGLSVEDSLTIEFSESTPKEDITLKLNSVLEHPPESIWDERVLTIIDYRLQTCLDLTTNTKSPSPLPKADAIGIYSQHHWIVIRPSGTEPKLKIYAGLYCEADKQLEKQKQNLHEKLKTLLEDFKKRLA